VFAIQIAYGMQAHDAIAECNGNTVENFGSGISLSSNPKALRITVKDNVVPSIRTSGQVKVTASGNRTPDGKDITV